MGRDREGDKNKTFYVSSRDVRIVCPRLLFQDRQCKYNVNVERSRNHCCRGKAVSVTYTECVSVALVIQHAMRMRHIVICGLSVSTIFSHII